MKIILCGAIGSGKTTLAHIIEQKYDYKYVSDLDILKKNNVILDNSMCDYNAVARYSKLILNNTLGMEGNVIVDSNFSISPREMYCYKNSKDVIFLCMGFYSVEEDVLFELFKDNSNNNKYSDLELKSNVKTYKKLSLRFFKECNKFGFKFFDINKQKNLVMEEVLSYLNFKK